jgi:hypothetical protein
MQKVRNLLPYNTFINGASSGGRTQTLQIMSLRHYHYAKLALYFYYTTE